LGFKFFFEKSNIIKKKKIGESTKNNLIEDHILPLNINIKKNIIKYIKKHLINILKSSFFENDFNKFKEIVFKIEMFKKIKITINNVLKLDNLFVVK
tara:strand:+ start:485 stop:775 length:291 start_codon:yes stop_codon:yes gene_type:complete